MTNTVLPAFVIFVVAILVPTARSKGMKGCHHPMGHKMKKGCSRPTKKPVARMNPTRRPSKTPTAMPMQICPEATLPSGGRLFALVGQGLSRDAASAAAATYNCCGVNGTLPRLGDTLGEAMLQLVEIGDEVWAIGLDPPNCMYATKESADSIDPGSGPCDVGRLVVVEFACAA
jgi:hypothetical protein